MKDPDAGAPLWGERPDSSTTPRDVECPPSHVPPDLARYERQTRFAALGEDGQRALMQSHALIVGVGALGSHAAGWLARAGVGRVTLVDRDVVDVGNLHRQVLFDAADVGEPKATAARRHLERLGTSLAIAAVDDEFTAELAGALPADIDVIVDGTDNVAARALINDVAVDRGTPWIYGGAVGASGRAMVVVPGLTPCLRCLWPEPPATGELGTCETAGVLAPAVAHVAAFQATEAMKILAGRPTAITRGMFVIDVWSGSFEVRLAGARPDPGCASCGTRELPALHAPPADLVALCGRDAVQVRPAAVRELDLEQLENQLRGAVAELGRTPDVLRFRADGCRFTVFRSGRALLFGVGDVRRARILYDRWIGAVGR